MSRGGHTPQTSKGKAKLPLPMATPQKTEYISKAHYAIFPIDDEMFDNLTLEQIVSKCFPQSTHFIPKHINYSNKFYEAILEQTQSAVITHTVQDKQISYSKLKILHILSPKDWNSPFFSPKYVTSPTNQQVPYNYWDYMQAWENVILFQNPNKSHSWFLQFSSNHTHKIPNWFYQNWWFLYGAMSAILPQDLFSDFETFSNSKTFSNDETSFKCLSYFSQKSIPWIMHWNYSLDLFHSTPNLFRDSHVKWWYKYDKTKTFSASISLADLQKMSPIKSSTRTSKPSAGPSPFKSFKEAALSSNNQSQYVSSQDFQMALQEMRQMAAEMRSLKDAISTKGSSPANSDSGSSTQKLGEDDDLF